MAEITSDAVVGFAKQGHPQAIAVLLNRALVPKGAHVKVRQKQELIKILINFLRETDLEQLVVKVQEILNDIAPQNVERVQIFTQRLGDRQAAFRKEIVTRGKSSPRSQASAEPSALEFAQADAKIAATPPRQAVAPQQSSDSQDRYSVAEYLSQVSDIEELTLLEDHPFFTGTCPRCNHGYSHLENPPLFWDCQACGWRDDLNQKIPRDRLKETPQRHRINQGKRLGSYLIEAGLLSPAQIEVALADQQLNGIRLGEVLVRRGWIKEETVEYFMRKVVEPERQASTGQAEAYLESSRNLLKTLIHQNKSAQGESSDREKTSDVIEAGNQPSQSGSAPPRINEKETLILSDVDLPTAPSKANLNAVNERETLLLPELDMDFLDQN